MMIVDVKFKIKKILKLKKNVDKFNKIMYAYLNKSQ